MIQMAWSGASKRLLKLNCGMLEESGIINRRAKMLNIARGHAQGIAMLKAEYICSQRHAMRQSQAE